MKENTIKAAVTKTAELLKGVPEPWRTLAFPVVLGKKLQGDQELPDELHQTPVRRARPQNGKPTRSSTLRKLIAEGWFKRERSLADIRKELKNRGFSTKTTTLPSLVLPLVLEGKLKRKSVPQGEKEFYGYYS